MSKVEMDFGSGGEDDSSLLNFVNKSSIKRAKNRSGVLKTPRQKYCEAWELSFPWLKGDKVDECLGICTICNKQLVCKKSHLERHQASFKHQRAMGFEVAKHEEDDDDDQGEDKDDNDFEEYEIEHIDIVNESGGNGSSQQIPEDLIKDESPSQKKKIQNKAVVPKKRRTQKLVQQNIQKNNEQANLMRLKLLKRIDKDRNELNEYYYARQNTRPSTPKDTFDLFFDSISASVKALPLKLGYEFKSKVSQLLTEFELRALCEKEAEEKAANYPHSSTPVIVSSGLDGIIKTNSPQVVYSFQPK